ncbi:MAG: cation transporter [Candidatus Zixiibacteriota bacterium]|nr:MAG: cation transporter [candidate division Zixibacteria bacterium]
MTTVKEKIGTPEASTKLSLLSNILLLVLKFYGGFFGGSRALIADCINSLLDIIANSAVWIGLNLAKKPADEDHQYGHGNADVIAASFVALIILVTGFYIGYDSIHVIIDGRYGVPKYFATGIALFTIIFKSFLYIYTKNVGIKFKSAAVLANAYDHKSDVYASSGALFSIIVSQIGYPILDPIGGLWVSFFILRNAINLIRDNIHTLMSGAPDSEMIERVTRTVDEIKEVKGVNTTRIRTLGSRHLVDLEIFVEKDLSVLEGHKIAHHVRDILIVKYDDISDVMIHVEPFMENRP